MSHQLEIDEAVVGIIGLGYVGLPLAQAFSRSLWVIGYDTDEGKVEKLNRGNDYQSLFITTEPAEISQANFIIITVPTPVTSSKEPDLSYVESAARTAGQQMKNGCVVILESTVYPGVTEEVVKPILEKESGLKCGVDFKIAYSPERINPGDTEHDIDKVTKVVSGMDGETTELIAQLYHKVAPNIFKAKDIKTAEAAKVIENVQRDLNIALMNELALIFEKMGLDTEDVFAAAATKWNFHRYSPGLVGGHCIPVDPYYLVSKARQLGYSPQIILSGRTINDFMPKHIVEQAVEALNKVGKAVNGSKILIMGFTYKENVADIRETPVKAIIKELKECGVEIIGYDPLLGSIEDDFGIPTVKDLKDTEGIDCIIIAAAHSVFNEISLDDIRKIMKDNPILIDVRRMFRKEEAEIKGFCYKTL